MATTPDDPEYALFPVGNLSDTIWYPHMIKYMDKMIGKVVAKATELGIINNTVFMVTADNGSPQQILSLYNNQVVRGGKGTPSGTHAPFIVYQAGHAMPRVDTTDINFADFLPTLADIARIPVPTNYGTLDGVSFFNKIEH